MTANEIESMGGVSGAVTLVCNGVGAALLRIQRFPNELIPFACYAVGAVVVPALTEWNSGNAVRGFIAGAAAVGLNQGLRQITQQKPTQ